ncbi:MAG: FG-GAP repeat protein [Myxococcota bacterium]
MRHRCRRGGPTRSLGSPRPWASSLGRCTLDDLGAARLWTEFVAARLTTGDLDGDGWAELVAGSAGQPAWGLNPDGALGWAFAVRDPVVGDVAFPDASWLVVEGLDPAEGFGADAAVGDFNGDGCADLAVGANGSDLNAYSPPGKVYVFDGPFTGGTLSAADADVVLQGEVDWDFFGFALAVGDYDGDGIDDLAVSAPWDDTAGWEAGSVYILTGARSADPG